MGPGDVDKLLLVLPELLVLLLLVLLLPVLRHALGGQNGLPLLLGWRWHAARMLSIHARGCWRTPIYATRLAAGWCRGCRGQRCIPDSDCRPWVEEGTEGLVHFSHVLLLKEAPVVGLRSLDEPMLFLFRHLQSI